MIQVWQKRFFVLRPQHIAYYKDEREYKLLRDIPLYKVRTCAPVELKKHVYVFGIVTPERTYYVEASSSDELSAWVTSINTTRDEAIASQGPSHSGSISDDHNQLQQQLRLQPLDPHDQILTPPSISIPSASSAPIPIGTSNAPLSSTQPSSSYAGTAFSDAGTLSSSVSSQYSPTAAAPSTNTATHHPQHDDNNATTPLSASSSSPHAVESIITSFNPVHTQNIYSPGAGPTSAGVVSSSEDDEDDYVAELPASLQRAQLSASTSSAGSINLNKTLNPPPPQQQQQPDINSGLALNQLDPNKVIFAGYLTKQVCYMFIFV